MTDSETRRVTIQMDELWPEPTIEEPDDEPDDYDAEIPVELIERLKEANAARSAAIRAIADYLREHQPKHWLAEQRR